MPHVTADVRKSARLEPLRVVRAQLFRHYTVVCTWLNEKPYYGTDANPIATRTAHDDVIAKNYPQEQLKRLRYNDLSRSNRYIPTTGLARVEQSASPPTNRDRR